MNIDIDVVYTLTYTLKHLGYLSIIYLPTYMTIYLPT